MKNGNSPVMDIRRKKTGMIIIACLVTVLAIGAVVFASNLVNAANPINRGIYAAQYPLNDIVAEWDFSSPADHAWETEYAPESWPHTEDFGIVEFGYDNDGNFTVRHSTDRGETWTDGHAFGANLPTFEDDVVAVWDFSNPSDHAWETEYAPESWPHTEDFGIVEFGYDNDGNFTVRHSTDQGVTWIDGPATSFD